MWAVRCEGQRVPRGGDSVAIDRAATPILRRRFDPGHGDRREDPCRHARRRLTGRAIFTATASHHVDCAKRDGAVVLAARPADQSRPLNLPCGGS